MAHSSLPGPVEDSALASEEAASLTAAASGGRTPARSRGGRGGNGGRGADTHSDLSTLARGGVLNIVGAVASGVFSFVLILVITHGLGAEGAGFFLVAIALFGILQKVSAFGADVGMVRMIPRYRALGRLHDVRRSLAVGVWPVVVCGSVLGGAMFFFAPELAHLMTRGAKNQQAIVPYIRVLGPFVPLAAIYDVLTAATRGFGTMLPTFVIEKVGRPGMQPLLALLVILAGMGSVAISLSWGGPLAAGLVFSFIWLLFLLRRAERRHGPRQDATRSTKSLAAEFWRFAAPRGLAGTFQITFVWLSPILISALRSTREAGVYAAATRYLVVGTLALQAIIQVMGPKISELFARESHVRAQSVYQTATQWLMVLTWPFYITLAVFAPFLLKVFGEGFTSGQTTLLILSIAMLVSTAVGPVDAVLLMGGKSSWNLFNTVLALAVNVVLNVVLVPRFGMNGAAIALAASIIVNNLAPLAQVWKFLKLHPFGFGFPRVAVPAVMCYGVLGVLTRVTLGESLSAFVVFAVVATALYTAALWWFRDALDLTLIREATSGKLRRRKSPATTPVSA